MSLMNELILFHITRIDKNLSYIINGLHFLDSVNEVINI